MEQSQTKILLVDESRFFLTIEKQFLRNIPVTLLEAQSAAQALAFCRDEKPQLIYLAQEITGMPGSQCCLQIKADPALRQIPIIMICEPGEENLCHLAGCNAVLLKPLDRHRFLEVGRSFLAGIRERRRSCIVSTTVKSEIINFAARGLDISGGGIFLDTTANPPIGTAVQLDIHLARPHETGPHIHCSGVVAWHNTRENPQKPNHPVGLGIKFHALSTQTAAVLNGFLHSFD
ncbi:MAG: PilZ domain-containing protein [Desulfuromonadales bacterium]|nr:PilZ domain-containing protein [Desulfuromonadales bacterium]